jgi:hypothetical protein
MVTCCTSLFCSAPLNVPAMARTKLPTALIGRDWLWTRVIEWVQTDSATSYLLLVADAGLCLMPLAAN